MYNGSGIFVASLVIKLLALTISDMTNVGNSLSADQTVYRIRIYRIGKLDFCRSAHSYIITIFKIMK